MTLIGQKWVGGSTLYAPERWESREALHNAILRNQLRETATTWDSQGANGVNIRLLTVWAAEGLHRLTGMRVQRAYLWIESTALLASCLLLYAFLQAYAGWQFALGGLLYWGTVLPLTYFHHHFHPWDKPSMALWLLALICTWHRRWWALAAVLFIGVLTKYDIVVFPALVFLAFRKTDPWKPVVLRAGLLFGLTFSTFIILRWLVPGGFERRSALSQVMTNLQTLRETTITYPPLLAVGPLALLAVLGYRTADHFARGCVQLALIVAGILFLGSNFVEFRSMVPLLLLLLPAAWFGFLRLTGAETRPAEA
jgi:hypothetical protein